jgi:hypothetical protein
MLKRLSIKNNVMVRLLILFTICGILFSYSTGCILSVETGHWHDWTDQNGIKHHDCVESGDKCVVEAKVANTSINLPDWAKQIFAK